MGKTDLCIRLAHLFSAPIVNADSRQVYREMKIGTARPDEAELAQARFYFVGNLSITDYYSAARYEQDALRLLAELFRTSDYVILSGGSMMYVDAVVKGIDDIPTVPDDIRAWLDSMDEKTLRESLKAIGDACRAAGFDPAMQACGEILRSNRDMGLHADSLTPIALRMRDGEWEYPGGIEEPDLSGYDRFITGTDDGGEER